MGFQQRLHEHFGFTPTNEQTVAIEKLTDYLAGKINAQAFLLKGYAGTGKTTLISALIKTLEERDIPCVLLAPTGRAAKVLGGYSSHAASTIHRQIYAPQYFPHGGYRFVLARNPFQKAVFIVDEVSMISDDSGPLSGSWGQANSLLEDLMTYTLIGSNKLIFLGDTAQLPPVGTDVSPVFRTDYIFDKYQVKTYDLELKEVVRQASESTILKNATTIRECLGNDFLPQLELDMDFRQVDGYALQEELEDAVSEFGEEQVLIICRSNKRANRFNQEFRHRIKWHEEELSAGERMMVVRNNYFWLKDDPKNALIANGDFAEILSVRNEQEIYGTRFADVSIRLPDAEGDCEIDCKIWLDAIHAETANMPFAQRSKMLELIEEDFPEVLDLKKRKAKARATEHYQALEMKFGYAVTCHKSQGGQWDAVFIDPEIYDEAMLEDDEFLRWLYTAVTRAVKRVYLLNFPTQMLLTE